MAEQPPLNRSYVISYAANDRDFPTIGLRADPRVAGYRVPEDLSPHPDSKRYPNHVFTGSQPSNGDERVTHIYEILPAPYVPFTRYDDDLGPIQGRRRSVKNEGQVARLGPDQRVNYEAREGSAIVYTEIEEAWSVTTDDDGNSLFPIRDRDFYDASRGAVQERRQLFVPTGEEEGSLENINGVITQTSYEPYNEFLSVKIVQTYKVNGPQLIGNTTNQEGQLATVTTQRKGALGYIPPNPTATKTVEVSREDAESLIERIVDLPEVFRAETFSAERPDPVPQKFRVAIPIRLTQENVIGSAETPALSGNDLSKSEEQQTKFVKRVSTTSRNRSSLPRSLSQKTTTNEGLLASVTETLQSGDTSATPTATRTVQSEALGDGTYVVTVTDLPKVFVGETYSIDRPDLIPSKFRERVKALTTQETKNGKADPNIRLLPRELSKSEQQTTDFLKRTSVTSQDLSILPLSLTQIATDNDKQVVTVTETLQSEDSVEPPSATVSIQSEALGSKLYVVTKTSIPKVFEAKIFRVRKDDSTPSKFRALQETVITEETLEGTAKEPELEDENEFEKSEQQVTEFVKRISTTSRKIDSSVELEETVLTPQGQIGRRTITLASNAQSFTPSAKLIEANVENLGDNRTVKTEVVVDNVFQNKIIRKSKIDLTPQKFKAKQEDVTIEETIEGKIDGDLSLEEGQFSKSEEQVTEFIKRTSRTERDVSASTNLEEFVVTPQGQLAKRILRLSSEPQSIQPDSKLIEGSIEELGDGRTVKTEVRIANVFDGKTISATKPDTIPEKFRVNSETTRTEEVVPQDDVNSLSLGENEYSKTEQRLTEFTVQKTTVERGDNYNEVESQRLEENWGINIPYKEYISNSIPSGSNIEVEGLSDTQHLVREYDRTQLDQNLSSFSVTFPTSIDLDLPRELDKIKIDWQEEKSDAVNDFVAGPISGNFTSLTQEDRGYVSSSLTLLPKIEISLKDRWGKNLPAETHLFFLKKDQLNNAQIRGKVGATANWPSFKLVSFSTTVYGISETKSIEAKISRAIQINDTAAGYGYTPSSGQQSESSKRLIPVSINIPPCLNRGITINGSTSKTLSASNLQIVLNYPDTTLNGVPLVSPDINVTMQHTIEANASFTVPTSSGINAVPTSGKYLISSSVEPYKFEWFLVRATTLDAGIFD
jgi:hypothetical protein